MCLQQLRCVLGSAPVCTRRMQTGNTPRARWKLLCRKQRQNHGAFKMLLLRWMSTAIAGNGDTLGLAARFFDRNCAGVLEGDDLEEIAFMTAPPVSRASPSFPLFFLCFA